MESGVVESGVVEIWVPHHRRPPWRTVMVGWKRLHTLRATVKMLYQGSVAACFAFWSVRRAAIGRGVPGKESLSVDSE
jgi:hypothetical protein